MINFSLKFSNKEKIATLSPELSWSHFVELILLEDDFKREFYTELSKRGVCIRIHPTNFNNAPGYQVDMGNGYWGCLWEERRAEMVQKYPDSMATKLVAANGWNHYYHCKGTSYSGMPERC